MSLTGTKLTFDIQKDSLSGVIKALYAELALHDASIKTEANTLQRQKNFRISHAILSLIGCLFLIVLSILIDGAFVEKRGDDVVRLLLMILVELLCLAGVVFFCAVVVFVTASLVSSWPEVRANSSRFRLQTLLKTSELVDDADLQLVKSLRSRFQPEVLIFASKRLDARVKHERAFHRATSGVISFVIVVSGIFRIESGTFGTITRSGTFWLAAVYVVALLVVFAYGFIVDFGRLHRLELLVQVLKASSQLAFTPVFPALDKIDDSAVRPHLP